MTTTQKICLKEQLLSFYYRRMEILHSTGAGEDFDLYQTISQINSSSDGTKSRTEHSNTWNGCSTSSNLFSGEITFSSNHLLIPDSSQRAENKLYKKTMHHGGK
jgi:hypothetical protein